MIILFCVCDAILSSAILSTGFLLLLVTCIQLFISNNAEVFFFKSKPLSAGLLKRRFISFRIPLSYMSSHKWEHLYAFYYNISME